MYDLLSGLNERSLANLIVQPIEESYNATGLFFKHTWFYAVQLVYITIFLSVKNINSFYAQYKLFIRPLHFFSWVLILKVQITDKPK